MASIEDEDTWWETGESGPNAGPALYWLATIIAALIVIFAIADFFINWAEGAPIVRIFAFITAAAVWLIGRACRAVLAYGGYPRRLSINTCMPSSTTSLRWLVSVMASRTMPRSAPFDSMDATANCGVTVSPTKAGRL
jgi:hypothetical protein